MATFTYYTFPGNAEMMHTIFNMVAMTSNSGTVVGAAQSAALFGFIVMLCVAVYKLDLRDSFMTIIGAMVIWTGLMTPKSTVVIEASNGLTNTVLPRSSVDNVPFGLAASASFISQFGLYMTQKMEQFSNLPSELNYSKSGILLAPRLMDELHQVSITDPKLMYDWSLFMNNCAVFDIHRYARYSIEDLRNSETPLTVLQNSNSTLFTTVSSVSSTTRRTILGTTITEQRYSGGSESMICSAAAKQLAQRTKQYINGSVQPLLADKVLGLIGLSSSQERKASAAVKATVLSTMGNASLQTMLNNSRINFNQSLENQVIASMMRQSTFDNARMNNNPELVAETLAKVQAKRQYITSQKTGASMASWHLPIVRAILEAVLIGLFPLVVVISLLSGIFAFKTIMTYIQALLWVQLWSPIAAIINMVVMMYASGRASAYTDIIKTYTTDNLQTISADAQAVAGSAMWLIPVVSGALVMAGRGLMQGFMGTSTASKSNAESVGSAAGAGNFSYGNMNANNASANKDDRSHSWTDPTMGVVRNRAGQVIGAVSSNNSASNIGTGAPSWTGLGHSSPSWVGNAISSAVKDGAGFALSTGGDAAGLISNENMSSGPLSMTSQISHSDLLSRAASMMYNKARTFAASYEESIGKAQASAEQFIRENASMLVNNANFMSTLTATQKRTLSEISKESSGKKNSETKSEGDKQQVGTRADLAFEGGVKGEVSGGLKVAGNGATLTGYSGVKLGLSGYGSNDYNWSNQTAEEKYSIKSKEVSDAKVRDLARAFVLNNGISQVSSDSNRHLNSISHELRNAQTAKQNETLAYSQAEAYQELAQTSVAKNSTIAYNHHDLVAGTPNDTRFAEAINTVANQVAIATGRTDLLKITAEIGSNPITNEFINPNTEISTSHKMSDIAPENGKKEVSGQFEKFKNKTK